MHLGAVLLLLFGGIAGVWFGLVDDIKIAFFVGFVAVALSVVGAFRGNFNPPEDIPLDARLDRITGVYAGVIVLLLFAGAAGIWFGLVDDFKIGFLIGVVIWAGALVFAFRGNAGASEPTASVQPTALVFPESLRTMAFAGLIVGALAVGAAGIWFGLVDDFEIGFFIGLLAWAGALIAAIRGTPALR